MDCIDVHDFEVGVRSNMDEEQLLAAIIETNLNLDCHVSLLGASA